MTITNSLTHKERPDFIHFESYITATSNDTTDPINGASIDVAGLSIRSIVAQATVTDANAAASANLILQGSLDGTGWFTLKDTSGSAIQTGATSIGTATAATPIVLAIDTDSKSRRDLPLRNIRVQVDQSGTPGFTGVVSLGLSIRTPGQKNS